MAEFTSEMPDIELGAEGEEFRIWKAREVIRQAEMIMTAQTQNLQAAERRASSLIGWMIAVLAAIGASIGPSTSKAHTCAAIVAMLFGLVSIGLCAWALWPKDWHYAGVTPGDLKNKVFNVLKQESELYTLDVLSFLYEEAINKNGRTASEMAGKLELAYVSIGVAALGAFIVILSYP